MKCSQVNFPFLIPQRNSSEEENCLSYFGRKYQVLLTILDSYLPCSTRSFKKLDMYLGLFPVIEAKKTAGKYGFLQSSSYAKSVTSFVNFLSDIVTPMVIRELSYLIVVSYITHRTRYTAHNTKYICEVRYITLQGDVI